MADSLRIDKWLWQARFFKTRSLATSKVQAGRFRLNGTVIAKPSVQVKPDDVLTFPLNDHVRVIKVLALGTRRGPAPEAQALYKDLDPPQPKPRGLPVEQRLGRPDKKERRAALDLKRSALE